LTAQEELDLALNVKTEKERVEFVLAEAGIQLSALSYGIWLPRYLKRGLVLHYSFDENRRDEVADRTGNRHHGRVNGATWVERGKLGGACRLDGEDDFIELPNSPSMRFDRGGCISLWINVSEFPESPSSCVVFSQGDMGGLWAELYSNKHLAMRIASSNRSVNLAITSVDAGHWHHIAILYDGEGGTGIAVIDGKQRKRIKVSPYTSNRTTGYTLGKATCSAGARNRYFNGYIDEVMIWNRALSDAEIKQVYKLTGGQ